MKFDWGLRKAPSRHLSTLSLDFSRKNLDFVPRNTPLSRGFDYDGFDYEKTPRCFGARICGWYLLCLETHNRVAM